VLEEKLSVETTDHRQSPRTLLKVRPKLLRLKIIRYSKEEADSKISSDRDHLKAHIINVSEDVEQFIQELRNVVTISVGT